MCLKYGISRINRPDGLRAGFLIYQSHFFSLDKTTCTENFHDADASTYTTPMKSVAFESDIQVLGQQRAAHPQPLAIKEHVEVFNITAGEFSRRRRLHLHNTHEKRRFRVRHPRVRAAEGGAPTALSDQRTRGSVQYYSRRIFTTQAPPSTQHP